MRGRRCRPVAGMLVVAVAVAVAAPGALAQTVPLGPNPSECEIQAALLGVAGPDCPPLRMRRPPPPDPSQPAPPPLAAPPPAAPAKPGPVAVPALEPPPDIAKPTLRAAFRIEFAFNSAVIRPESRAILDRVAAVMTGPEAGKARFRIVGHTDAVGGDAANLALSERRARAVAAYLVETHRIAPERLEASGRGLRELLLPDQPKAAANRRVEIINLGE
ncbi:outer membrane protein OmpA-like peptidoglycan-associated protein [Azospirillum agricola]|uniref:OmpA family protein n=1 Tax=Azospirillum agricola TaxID=1720247 RepID=UPI001F1FD33F|nr:OmpA family protein [Azospirillum agricola]MBP2228372.1 outer membrane protein OmpA-like peptidoglycan-associated protein [Azospirillum agricola]